MFSPISFAISLLRMADSEPGTIRVRYDRNITAAQCRQGGAAACAWPRATWPEPVTGRTGRRWRGRLRLAPSDLNAYLASQRQINAA